MYKPQNSHLLRLLRVHHFEGQHIKLKKGIVLLRGADSPHRNLFRFNALMRCMLLRDTVWNPAHAASRHHALTRWLDGLACVGRCRHKRARKPQIAGILVNQVWSEEDELGLFGAFPCKFAEFFAPGDASGTSRPPFTCPGFPPMGGVSKLPGSLTHGRRL